MLRWLWENQFAAVASDTPSLEPAPIKHEKGMTLHEWCLAGWGMPIGEYFDLEELATYCREKGRWGFFLCSVPLKVSLFLFISLVVCGLWFGMGWAGLTLDSLFRFLGVWLVRLMQWLFCDAWIG